uniref:UPF0716 protein FxsA n=1 Tax=Candidatus Kentrum sp. SD TaxID=2126332 RepID=A0A451BHQ5_9GAMM|nr:MAG: UPF0716 protein FxsA [Candidatus Kentron sp. SD]
MSTFYWLFLFFLLTPVAEIYFLIKVGGTIGVWPTVILVVLTALIGAYFVKQQGVSILFRIRDNLTLDEGEPLTDVLEGIVIVVAGALLLTPGFITDTVGFICLVPSWRRLIVSGFLSSHWGVLPTASSSVYRSARGSSGSVIEGNFRRED